MKKFIILIISVLFFWNLNAQTVNDIPIKDLDVDYVTIVGKTRTITNKITVELDFGQEDKILSSNKSHLIADATGKTIKFNSMMDALNFLSQNGFSFVQAYVFTEENENVFHYILKKD